MARRAALTLPASTRAYATLEHAGIPRVDEHGRTVDVHALRGTAATRLLRNNVQLAHVAKILGHQDVCLTMRHYEDLGIEDLKAEVDKVPTIASSPKPAKPKGTTRSQQAS